MKILFIYTGSLSTTAIKEKRDLLADLRYFPTTHMSEVNCLLICHCLQQAWHEITVLTEAPATGRQHFKTVTVRDLVPKEYDAVLIFKLHGLKFAKRVGLDQFTFKQVAVWADSPKPDVRADAFLWATPALLKEGEKQFPESSHTLCEHATTFPFKSKFGSTQYLGLYMGRLPKVYLNQLVEASDHAMMKAYALWVSDPKTGEQILLRPSQLVSGALDRAKDCVPSNVELHPGTNMLNEALTASSAAFGLCPAAGLDVQVRSACKFYDYLALGLPVVCASNIPEADHIRSNPELGVLYDQGVTGSLGEAIDGILHKAVQPDFILQRVLVQTWVYDHATYEHRARTIASVLD